jgi:hypothetical protein
MFRSEKNYQWLNTIMDQLSALDGVEVEELKNGHVSLALSYNGLDSEIFIVSSAGDYRAQKVQYRALREAISRLGVKEGQDFIAPPPTRRALTPQIIAAREKKKKIYGEWQALWRLVRKAEKALDVEYEIAQMKDYY